MSALQDLAEGYVLGLLDEGEQSDVDARLKDPRTEEDRVLTAAVGTVRDRLLPLDLTAPELPLRPGSWERLEAALGAVDTVRPAPRPDPAPSEAEPSDATPLPPGGGWRRTAIAAMAAAVLLAASLGWQLFLARDPAVLVVLLDQGGDPVALLEAFTDNNVRVTPLTGVQPGPTEVLQLWTKPDPAGAPVSVGLIEQAARMIVDGPELPAPAPGQLYEITVEQAGGSPTGLPTGRIVGLGNAQALVLD